MEHGLQDIPVTEDVARKRGRPKNWTSVRLPIDSLERQSGIALLGWTLLGPDAAITYLNSYDPELEARPLDLAIASREGYALVEHAVRARAGGAT